ncbi:MAG: class I SAM-dependent methyltransferase [Gammaproteobacteria bacterium]|nr:class I SAM-dependent methyltransferase [Gammaproteobacteria bacterium]
MERTPEPELMEDPVQAAAYAGADFSEPNQLFIQQFQQHLWPLPETGNLIDLGCGPGDIIVSLAPRLPGYKLVGVDGSEPMLRYAADRTGPPLAQRVRWVNAQLPALGNANGHYQAVISNSLLHHLHRPSTLWNAIRELMAPNGAYFVMDLLRPHSEAQAAAIVTEYAGDEPELLRRDFYHSLLAAYRPREIRAQLAAASLPGQVRIVSDRHLIIYGRGG